MYGQQPSPHAYPASPPSYQMKRQCSYTHSTPTPIHPPVDGMSRSASYFPSSEHRPYSPPTPPMDMSSQQKVSLPPISHLMSLVGSSTSHQQRPRVEIPKFHTVPAEYQSTPKEVLPPTPPMSYNGIGSALAHQSSGSRLSPLPSEHSRPLVREQRLSMASESSVYSAISNRSRSPASVSTPASALSSAYSDSYHLSSAYQPQSVLGKRPTPADFHPARDLPVPMQHPRSPESTPASASTSPVSTHKHLDNETHSVSTGASSPNSQFVPSERYLCQQCNKAFSRPSSLRIHSHSHTGEKPYKCPHKSCGKAFSVRSNMKRHEKGCHAEERDRLMEMMGNSRPAERELLPAAAA